jgi:hypothetical protein
MKNRCHAFSFRPFMENEAVQHRTADEAVKIPATSPHCTMKNQRIQLRLDHPCTQKWSEMTPSGRGRFCGSCQKNVVDFTAMTDNEILQFIQANTSGFCGQFRATQLNRELVHTKLNGNSSRLHSLLTGLAIAGAAGALPAQVADTTTPPAVVIDSTHRTGPVCLRPDAVKTTDLTLTINVTDTLIHQPVAFAAITLHGMTAVSGTTDSAGNITFRIAHDSLPDSLTMTVQRAGYQLQTVTVHTQQPNQQVNVYLDQLEIFMLGGPMIMVEPEPTKRIKK